MKKLALLVLLTLVGLGFSTATFAETEAAATGPYDVLNMLGFETPGWMLDQGTDSASYHPTCYNRPGCSYRLVGCCCVSSGFGCSTYCF